MITPRLQCIINHVNSTVAADIGCDHAYVPIALIDEKRAEHVIACDINKGPVLIADENIKKYNKQDFIETRIGAGLSPILNNEADTIIIAGMGGELICSILNDDIEKAKNAKLVLQPMNAQDLLRHFLIENGFEIVCEDLAVEGFKVYNILEVTKGESTPYKKEIHYHIPPYLKVNKYYNELYEKKKREFTKIITGLKKSQNPDIVKMDKYIKLLEDLENENK